MKIFAFLWIIVMFCSIAYADCENNTNPIFDFKGYEGKIGENITVKWDFFDNDVIEEPKVYIYYTLNEWNTFKFAGSTLASEGSFEMNTSGLIPLEITGFAYDGCDSSDSTGFNSIDPNVDIIKIKSPYSFELKWYYLVLGMIILYFSWMFIRIKK